MFEWKLYAVSRSASSASMPFIHFMSMSSINLSNENGFRLIDCSSCLPAYQILAYDGASFVPMAVPRTGK